MQESQSIPIEIEFHKRYTIKYNSIVEDPPLVTAHYSFKPESLNNSIQATLHINRDHAKFSFEVENETLVMNGNIGSSTGEAVLIFDENGDFMLKKVNTVITGLKRTQHEANSNPSNENSLMSHDALTKKFKPSSKKSSKLISNIKINKKPKTFKSAAIAFVQKKFSTSSILSTPITQS
jgi:hypothetical protein